MTILGVDFGGTHIRAGLVRERELIDIISIKTPALASQAEVLGEFYKMLDSFKTKGFDAIGLGVPSVVDSKKGMIYDVQNIPSLKEVSLVNLFEKRYNTPVLINNDTNCFALGEKYFGFGEDLNSFVALSIGTGIGGGIIIDDNLYSGNYCGAGEFGMIEYLEHNYEYYASGQFFENFFNIKGIDAYQKAINGDKLALRMFKEFGKHLGNVIKMILYAYAPDNIVIGGSIRKAFPLFKESMRESINSFTYQKSLGNLDIKVSKLDHVGVLGAAALWYDHELN